jgi:high-affinity iron transporter
LICLIAGGTVITIFYKYGRDVWQGHEYYYEGSFAILAAVVITVMGAALLRIGKMQEKWRIKLAESIDAPINPQKGGNRLKQIFEKYAMFILPLITVLREGVEGILFVAGVSFQAPPSAVPLAVLGGLLLGSGVGIMLYK